METSTSTYLCKCTLSLAVLSSASLLAVAWNRQMLVVNSHWTSLCITPTWPPTAVRMDRKGPFHSVWMSEVIWTATPLYIHITITQFLMIMINIHPLQHHASIVLVSNLLINQHTPILFYWSDLCIRAKCFGRTTLKINLEGLPEKLNAALKFLTRFHDLQQWT